MHRTLALAVAVSAGLLTSAEARPAKQRAFAPGTPVVVVGSVTSQPRNAGVVVENKMQVGVGPAKRDYTLHLKDAELVDYQGRKVETSSLKDKMWVRAEGKVMDDARRISVSRLQIIGADVPWLQQSPFYRAGFEQGYVMAVAGSRETYPRSDSQGFEASPFTIVGRVSDDTGTLETSRRLQIQSAGNRWTLHVNKDADVLDGKGEKISVHEIKQGQWVRATGWQTDDLRMRITRVENLGTDEAYRGSALYRNEAPLGYLDRVTGLRTDGKRVTVRGTITFVDTEGGYFTLRDADGKEHAVYAELAEIRNNDRSVRFNTLRTGEIVTVEVRHIQF